MKARIRATAAVALAALASAPLAAQDAEEKPWEYEAVVGGSLFFGASRQTAISLSNGYAYEAEWLEFEASAGFAYAESEDAAGDDYVSQRGWNAGMNLDYRPEATFSPFALVSGEGSLARRIDRRLSGGLGAKVRFVDSDAARLDFSVAALLERTDFTDRAGEEGEVETAGRWSARLRGERDFGERLSGSIQTFYRPAISDFGDDYTVDFRASLGVTLTRTTSLQFSVTDKFDSLAEERGARSNHDGRFLISVSAKY